MNPTMFGRYLLLDKVAAGGMAEVWRGKITGEANFQRIVAIKKILPHVSEDEDFITMFTDEALITASLVHANIGQVYEFSKIGDVFYIAMEYISGKDLKSVWSWSKSRGATMPLELAAFVVAKMCDGLDYAHNRKDHQGNPSGVVHRDISPQNVLLSWDGDVKVIDFGIAKATEKSGKTRPGTLKGKFAYMAPEQIRGLPLDGRSDIFAIGVVLYELVTGQRGFQAESEFSLLEMVRNVEIRPPSLLNQDLPAEMERIIYKSLAKDRDQRYQSGAEMSEDLMRFLLQRGRPPSARDLSAFLKQNFTVDWEKEKGRLESYREVNPLDFQGGAQQAQQQAAVRAAVAAAGPASPPLADDAADDDAFASTAVKAPPPPPPSPGGIRPAAASNPVKVEPREVTAQTSTQLGGPKKSPLKLIAAALGGTIAVAGIAAGLWFTVLQPTTSVVITINGPSEATVRFDGEVRTVQGSTTFDKVKKGPHNLIVEANGFVPATLAPVTTGEPVMSLTPVLRRVAGRLSVTSEPSGAAISLDGKATDKKTPATFELEGDSLHEVRLELPDYKAVVRSDVRVPSGGERVEKLKLLPTVVTLRIITTPEGARVKIGGVDNGVTPTTIERSPSDPYPEVELSKDGCETLKTTVPFDREKREDQWEGRLKCR
jgi:serine/threonine protein kinase